MKKFLTSIVAGFAFVALSLLQGPTTVSAESDNAASVINIDTGCIIVGADWGGSGNLAGSVHNVATSNGNLSLVCKFEIPDGQEPDKAFVKTGFNCYTDFGFTTNSKAVATPGGQVSMVCQVKSAP